MRNPVIHIACLFALLFSVLLTSMGQEVVLLNSQHFFEVTGQPGYKYYWTVTSVKTGEIKLLSGKESISDTITFDELGTFEISVQPKDEKQCLGEKATMFVAVSGLVASAGSDQVIGQCQSIRLDGTYTLGEEITYYWEPSENLDDPSSPTPLFTPGETTEFVLTATDKYGITGTDTVKIEVVPLPQASLKSVYLIDPWEDIELDARNCMNGDCYQYNWETINGEIISGKDSSVVRIKSKGTYELTLTDNFGCKSILYAYVEENPWTFIAHDDSVLTRENAPVDIDVLANEEVSNRVIDTTSLVIVRHPYHGNIKVDHLSGLITYSPEKSFIGEDDFTYQICNKRAGDLSEANVYIVVDEVSIPEAFSPNGDGINDYFEIVGVSDYSNNNFIVFNRWGNKVYEKSNYQNKWDGTSNTGVTLGRTGILPEGTYFFILDLGTEDKKITGTVYLTR